MSSFLNKQKLDKLRNYYELFLRVTHTNTCDDHGCSEGSHTYDRCYTAVIPESFTLDDIDETGKYLGDWRKLSETKESAKDAAAKCTCILKRKVNLKRDIEDLIF